MQAHCLPNKVKSRRSRFPKLTKSRYTHYILYNQMDRIELKLL